MPYPVDHRTAAFANGLGWNFPGHLDLLNRAVKEQVGQLAYRLTKR